MWRQSVLRTVLSGLQVAVVGGVLAAVAESQLAAFYAGASGAGLYVRAAAVGSFVATHLALWVPMLLLLSVGQGVAAARGRWPRRFGPVEAMQAAVLLLAGGLFVAPGDLLLLERLTPLRYLGCVVAAALAALCIGFVVRRICSRPAGYRRFRIVLAMTTLPALAVACLTLAAMARTPFVGAGAFRLPEVAKGQKEGPSDRPNILLVMMDTVRADRLSCYGYGRQTMPELARFASEAIRYERVVPNGIWTVPSHASLFTGLAVRSHGMNHDHMHLDDSFDTLAELLGEAGYQTACISNNPYVSAEFNMTQGFAVELSTLAMRRLSKSFADAWCDGLGLAPLLPWLEKDLGAALNNYLFARWVDRSRDSARPFFVFLNYMEGHLPYLAPQEVRRCFLDPAQVARSYQLRRRVYGNIVNLLTAHYNFLDSACLSADDRAVLAGQYDACLYYLDSRLGELLQAIDRRGLREQTVVVFVSDHGEALGEHAQWSHELGVYDTLLHVPLLIRDGRSPAGRRVTRPVQLSDLFPTILRWAGVQNPAAAGSPSRDLMAEEPPERTVVGEQIVANEYRLRWAGRRDPGFDRQRFTRQLRAVVGPRYKYICSSDGRDELYDLREDPGELNNLIDLLPKEAERLAAGLKVWLEVVPKYEPSSSQASPEVDPKVLEALRGLGYVGGQ